jgi:hypothetical protein
VLTATTLRAIVTRELLQGADEAECLLQLSSEGIAPARIEACLHDVLADPCFAIGRATAKEALIGKRIIRLHGKVWLSRLAARNIPEFHKLSDKRFRRYFAENQAFILRNGAGNWNAVNTWTPESMSERFPDASVEYMRGAERYSNPQPRRRTTLRKFTEWLRAKPYSNEYYITATNVACRDLKALRADIGKLPFKALELDLSDNDMMRMWLGPGGTITPMHFDLMPNIFVQIYGVKTMLLAPPFILDWVGTGKGVFAPFDPIAPDLFANPRASSIRYWHVELKPGDVLYIPMGWWHWVYAKTTSISVNFFNVAVSGSRLGWRDVQPKMSSDRFTNIVTSLIEGAPLKDTEKAARGIAGYKRLEDHPVVRMLRPLAHRRRFVRSVLAMYRDLWLELGWNEEVLVLQRWDFDQVQEYYARCVPFIAKRFGVPKGKKRGVKKAGSYSVAAFAERSGISFVTDYVVSRWARTMIPRVVVTTKPANLALVPPFFTEPFLCQQGGVPKHDELGLKRCPFCTRFAKVALGESDALFVPAAWWLRAATVPRISAFQVEDPRIFELRAENSSGI